MLRTTILTATLCSAVFCATISPMYYIHKYCSPLGITYDDGTTSASRFYHLGEFRYAATTLPIKGMGQPQPVDDAKKTFDKLAALHALQNKK